MLNGKPGKRAIVVKSVIKNSPNLGKVLELGRLMTDDERTSSRIYSKPNVWTVDKDILWESYGGKQFYMKCIPDENIKLLPDLDEEFEETTIEKEIRIVD